jgi:hypothetical protein
MNVVRFAWISAIATAAIALGGHRASAQYYGYASQQSPAPSGQAAYPCQPCQACHGCVPTPPPPCQPQKCGCDVVYCPPTTCQPAGGCIPNPPYYPPPGCQAACEITDECAPTKPVQWVSVYRNHYVPIRIVKTPSQYDVQPVSIQVNERIVHYLCDCPPGTTQCPHVPGGTPQTSASPRPASESAAALAQAEAKTNASANLTGQANPSAGPTAEKTAATPASSASPHPASESAALAQAAAKPAANTNLTGQADSSARPTAENTAATPAKQWIWLSNENRYGYGFINEKGFAIVDPATTTTPPTVAAAN